MAYEPGPYDSAHLYLQWGGKLPGGEEWSCGLRLMNLGGAIPETEPAMLAALVTSITNFHNGGAAGISALAKLSFVKLNAIGVDGHYVYDTTQETVLADISGGGTGSGFVPNQLACAVSLTTGFSRGPAHRGRFFLPMPVYATAADGMISAANAQSISGAVDTFIGAVNGASTDFDVAVFSRKLGAATHRPVTGNLVGRVLDTQRRRRRSLAENYQ